MAVGRLERHDFYETQLLGLTNASSRGVSGAAQGGSREGGA